MDRAAFFEEALNTDVLASFAALVLWGWAAYGAGRLIHRATPRRLRRAASRLLILLVLAELALLGRVAVIAVMGGYGWEFVAERVIIALPVVLLPGAAAVALTGPRLRRLARAAREAEPDGTAADPPEISPGLRRAAAAPHLVVPVQATALGAAAGFYLAFIAPVSPPFAGPALIVLTGWALGAGVLWSRQLRRVRSLPVRPRPLVRTLRIAVVIIVSAGVVAGGTGWAAQASRLPPRVAAHDSGAHTHGTAAGAANPAGASSEAPTVSVEDLTEPDDGPPDRRFTLVAAEKRIRLSSGATIDAWAFNGQVPGPRLQVREGDMVEVTLINRLPSTNVTVHWHGVDVPNAADGVPGVTQNAVEPGGRFTYRFRVRESGTHWYHSHQQSSEQVRRGLFGPLIIEPREGAEQADEDLFVPMHTWQRDGRDIRAFGLADQLDRRSVPAGTKVRLRVVVSSPTPRFFALTGTRYKITAVDGNRVNRPEELSDVRLTLGSGGRYDIEFTMPDGPVRMAENLSTRDGLLLSPDGRGAATPVPVDDLPDFDITRYGEPAKTPFGPDSRFDRTFTFTFDNRPGFFNGEFTFLWTINGRVYPDIPSPVVSEGELIKMRFVNRSHLDHPMHLHGHHVLVLSRNGRPVTGAPVWLDTVDVAQGEIWEVAFRADNPGAWMDHCHNQLHARVGQVMHLMYDNVRSPFRTGHATPNNPF